MAISFKHSASGLVKECPEGFSWTTFFFGPIVSLIRGLWVPAIVMLATFGFAGLYYMFAINKVYATHLMTQGYKPASDLDVDKVKMMGIAYAAESAPAKPVAEAA